MPKFSQFAMAKRCFVSWHEMLVCLAILCLHAHLVSRFHLPLSGTAVIQAQTAKVQHMDQDAYRWVPPPRSLFNPLSPALAPPPVKQEQGYLSPQIRCLCDRSPPACM